MRVALMILMLAIAGCASTTEPRVRAETVTVKVPVYKKAEPPAWLLAPAITPDQVGKIFVDPDTDGVVLGVTRDGLKQFYLLLDSSVTRMQAWRAWATTDTADGDSK